MKRDKNNDEHALASSRPSYRPRHPVILTAIRHTHCLFAYRFPLPGLFTKHATPTVVYPLSHSRLVPRLVLSRLVGRLVHISACPYMPYSLYRPVRSCSSGLVRSRLIAQRSTQRRYRHTNIIPYIHRILVSLYSCIFYIHRIHHIHYIHQSTRHDEPHADIQASSRRPASRPVRLKSNERHEAREIAAGNEKQAMTSQTGDAARLHAPQP